MAAYTQSIDLHISQTLKLRGSVTPQMLAGVNEIDALEMLRQYADIHAGQQRLHFDGQSLRVIEPPAATNVSSLEGLAPSRNISRWLVIGAVVVVVAIALVSVSFSRAGVRRSTAWPASPDGRVALYYFGTST